MKICACLKCLFYSPSSCHVWLEVMCRGLTGRGVFPSWCSEECSSFVLRHRSCEGVPECSSSVCERCRGSGGWSGSAPLPVTQHRHCCDWTAGDREGGREIESGKSGEKRPGDWGMIAADAGIYSAFHFYLFVPSFSFSGESIFFGSKLVLCTNTPPFSGPLLCHRGKRRKSDESMTFWTILLWMSRNRNGPGRL